MLVHIFNLSLKIDLLDYESRDCRMNELWSVEPLVAWKPPLQAAKFCFCFFKFFLMISKLESDFIDFVSANSAN